MRYVKWTAIALVVAVVAGFLHWSLPSRDIVRIVGTDVRRSSVETATDGQEALATRDIRFISGITPRGRARVYRNEDTGFGWPPFFKFDSANLAARAQDAISTEEDPNWMIVTHYGWRIPMVSAFPNAVSVRPAEGPDQRLIPWFNIVALSLLAVAVFAVRRQVLKLLGRGRARPQ